MAALTLFTIGHSTRTLEELVELLRCAGVTLVVDVRRFPGSRRHPQFGRERLAAGLAALQAVAAERPTAVLCAEADPSHCHRQLLADAMEAAAWEVVHLLAGGARERHRRHPRLRVDAQGGLSYPPAAAEEGCQQSLPGLGGLGDPP